MQICGDILQTIHVKHNWSFPKGATSFPDRGTYEYDHEGYLLFIVLIMLCCMCVQRSAARICVCVNCVKILQKFSDISSKVSTHGVDVNCMVVVRYGVPFWPWPSSFPGQVL